MQLLCLPVNSLIEVLFVVRREVDNVGEKLFDANSLDKSREIIDPINNLCHCETDIEIKAS